MSAIVCPVEDRLALQDLVTAYCLAVDDIGNVTGVTSLFTPDGAYDLTPLGLGCFTGTEAIGGFFETAFAGMAHNAHFAGNILVTSFAGNTAALSAYVHAFSLGKDGTMLEVRARYFLDCARTPGGWKIARLGMAMLIPL